MAHIDRQDKMHPTYLNVPFSEKDQAKSLGARWDPNVRRWYVPAGHPIDYFRRWLSADSAVRQSDATQFDDEENDFQVIERDHGGGDVVAWSPLFVAESVQRCWKCQHRTTVFALAGSAASIDGDTVSDEITLLSNVSSVPPELAVLIAKQFSSFKPAFSKTTGGRYYMNHCSSCGRTQGDFFLHEEPGGAFCPMTPEDARRIVLRALPITGGLQIDASVGVASPNLIHRYAQR